MEKKLSPNKINATNNIIKSLTPSVSGVPLLNPPILVTFPTSN